MALTGNLEVFPLQEVLRMLARSNKTGCLRVEAGGIQGRVFIANGALTLATVNTDDEFRHQLLASGLLSEDEIRSVDVGGGAISEAISGDNAGLTDFVREHVVESLYRIRKPGYGNFDFMIDVMPRYATGQTFDAEVAVSEAERRASEWADIDGAISDMNAPLLMVRELPDENSVSVTPPTWRVLAVLGSGASVATVANALGMSLFRAARELAGLVRSNLVEVGASAPSPIAAPAQPTAAPAPAEPWGSQPAAPSSEAPVPSWGEPEQSEAASWDAAPESAASPEPGWEQAPSPWAQEGPAAQAPGWETPVAEPEATPWGDTAQEQPPAPQGDAVETDADTGAGGWWAQAMGTPEAPAKGEDDADAFLESVFSQLDEGDEAIPSEDSEETGFSMGLLRRRRMGAVSKDITEG